MRVKQDVKPWPGSVLGPGRQRATASAPSSRALSFRGVCSVPFALPLELFSIPSRLGAMPSDALRLLSRESPASPRPRHCSEGGSEHSRSSPHTSLALSQKCFSKKKIQLHVVHLRISASPHLSISELSLYILKLKASCGQVAAASPSCKAMSCFPKPKEATAHKALKEHAFSTIPFRRPTVPCETVLERIPERVVNEKDDEEFLEDETIARLKVIQVIAQLLRLSDLGHGLKV